MSLKSKLKRFLQGSENQTKSTVTDGGGQMAIVEYPDGSTRLLPEEEAKKSLEK